MSSTGQAHADEQFTQLLRDALDHLYDTFAIQHNPLIDYFGQSHMTRLQKAQHLRKIILQCLQSLDTANSPQASPDRLAHRILEMRFLDSLSVDEVAAELAISKSQFFREQARAISLFTDIVWDRYQAIVQERKVPAQGPETNLVFAEAERLAAQSVREVVDLDQLIEEMSPTIKRFERPGSLHISIQTEGGVILPASNRVMLRQVVLILFEHAAARYPCGSLSLQTFSHQGVMGLRLSAQGKATQETAPEAQSIEISRELLARLGGKLILSEKPGFWQASLEWSTAKPTVLVVDDDEGILALFRRYLVGYPWNVLGAANGVEARRQIEILRPAVILLDVMMPQEDGWELLESLKRDPSTKNIPVIVCSVLLSPNLALNLGAAAYLPKPVSQQALIEALTRWSLTNLPADKGS